MKNPLSFQNVLLGGSILFFSTFLVLIFGLSSSRAQHDGTEETLAFTPLAATSRYPGCDTDDITVGDYTIAACNVGATTAGTTSASYGSLFQRGNNYPFPNDGSPINIIGTPVDASGYGPTNPYYSGAFIAGNSDRSSVPNDNLWGGTGDTLSTNGIGTDIERKGPCAIGYHVPTIVEWQGIITAGGWGTNGAGLSNSLKLPLAGCLRNTDGVLVDKGLLGYYWSSSSYFLGFQNRYIYPLYPHPRAYGTSVRCFKNAPDTEAPVITLLGSETVLLLLGETYIESGASWTDNLDGTGELLTATSGSVDTGTLGTYLLEYTYTDQAGNTGNTVTRTVTILEPHLPITTPESGGGGGGGTILKKDDCPDGDFSPSYYDRICNEMTESSEQSGTSGRTSPTPPSEGGQRDAQSEGEQGDTQSEGGWGDAQSLYQWAFQRGITTMPTLEEARMNDTITRAEMAKILVVATFPSTTSLTKEESSALSLTTSLTKEESSALSLTTSLTKEESSALSLTTPLMKGGRSEATGGLHTTEQALQKEGCQSFSDLKQVNAELQSFIIQVCQLGLMGYYADGQTLKPAFSPNATITVAEVATILSRILRGETYKGSEQWRYQNHLLALQKAGIIPRAVDPMSRELRGNVFSFLYQVMHRVL